MLKPFIYALDPDQTHDLLFVENIDFNIVNWLYLPNFPMAIPNTRIDTQQGQTQVTYDKTSGLLLFEKIGTNDHPWAEDYALKLFNFYKPLSTTGQYTSNVFNGYGIIQGDNYGDRLNNVPFPAYDNKEVEVTNTSESEIILTYFRDAFDEFAPSINLNEERNRRANYNSRVFMRDTLILKPNQKGFIRQCLIGSLVASGGDLGFLDLQIDPYFWYKNLDDILSNLLDIIKASFPKMGKFMRKLNYKIGYKFTLNKNNGSEKLTFEYKYSRESIQLADVPSWYHYAALVKCDGNDLGKPVKLEFKNPILEYSIASKNIPNQNIARETQQKAYPIGALTDLVTFVINANINNVKNQVSDPAYEMSLAFRNDLLVVYEFLYFNHYAIRQDLSLYNQSDANFIQIEKHPYLWTNPLITSKFRSNPFSQIFNYFATAWETTRTIKLTSMLNNIVLDRNDNRAYFESVLEEEMNIQDGGEIDSYLVSLDDEITQTIFNAFVGQGVDCPTHEKVMEDFGWTITRWRIAATNAIHYEFVSGVGGFPDTPYDLEQEFEGAIEFIPWENEPIIQNNSTITKAWIDDNFATLNSQGESENTNMPDSIRIKRIYNLLGGDGWQYGAQNTPSLKVKVEEILNAYYFEQVGENHQHSSVPKEVTADHFIDLFWFVLSSIFGRLGLQDYPVKRPSSLINPQTDINIHHLGHLNAWFHSEIDNLIGAFPIKIEIQDNDLIKTGNQTVTIQLPNLAESLAELMGLSLRNHGMINAILSATLRNLGETGSTRQTAITSYYLLEAIQDYLGFKTKQSTKDVDFTFDPTIAKEKQGEGEEEAEESITKALQRKSLKIKIEEFDDEHSLEEKLEALLQTSAIIRARYLTKVGEDALKPYFQGILDLMNGKKENQEEEPKDEFDEFIDRVERGFVDAPLIQDPQNPYGRTYERRPRIKQIDKDEEQGA